jgi:Fuc2NAc and GlcNAc transferase
MAALPSMAIAVGVFLAALWLTGRLRRYALDRQLLDRPNQRSSHSVAMPRGGGMAIVLATLLGLTTAAMLHLLSWPFTWGAIGGGGLVGGVGFLDDHRPLARRWRLLGHLAAAAWVLTCIGGMPPVQILGHVVDAGWPGHVLAALYLVWLINLTNFMDGIDGIAATEAVTVAGGGALLGVFVTGAEQGTAPLILAAASVGFLAWNWPPARIFMGDAGSGFLGLMLGALSLSAAHAAPSLLWAWIILLGVFITDATITLARRVLRGDRFYEAHRSHAYQHAAQRFGAHKPVTVAVAIVNLAWLLPLAALVAGNSVPDAAGVAAAYVPLVVGALKFGAGRSRPSAAQFGAPNV